MEDSNWIMWECRMARSDRRAALGGRGTQHMGGEPAPPQERCLALQIGHPPHKMPSLAAVLAAAAPQCRPFVAGQQPRRQGAAVRVVCSAQERSGVLERAAKGAAAVALSALLAVGGECCRAAAARCPLSPLHPSFPHNRQSSCVDPSSTSTWVHSTAAPTPQARRRGWRASTSPSCCQRESSRPSSTSLASSPTARWVLVESRQLGEMRYLLEEERARALHAARRQSMPVCQQSWAGRSTNTALPPCCPFVCGADASSSTSLCNATQERRIRQRVDDLERDTGVKLRVLAQNYPQASAGVAAAGAALLHRGWHALRAASPATVSCIACMFSRS